MLAAADPSLSFARQAPAKASQVSALGRLRCSLSPSQWDVPAAATLARLRRSREPAHHGPQRAARVSRDASTNLTEEPCGLRGVAAGSPERLFDRDASLWSNDPAVQAGIAERLVRDEIERIKSSIK